MFVPTVEKYRHDFKRPKTNRFGEDAPRGEKMRVGTHKRVYAEYRNITRWLVAQLGRAWNDVYADLCKMTAPKTLERLHADKAVKDIVELHVTVIDGVLCGQGASRPMKLFPGDLYVNNGVLARIPFKKVVKPARALRVEFIGQNEAIGVSGDQWFAVTFVPYTPKLNFYGHDVGNYDTFLKTTIGEYDAILAYGKSVVAVNKRALSKKEIKRYKASR